jgi:hypothetical protein
LYIVRQDTEDGRSANHQRWSGDYSTLVTHGCLVPVHISEPESEGAGWTHHDARGVRATATAPATGVRVAKRKAID